MYLVYSDYYDNSSILCSKYCTCIDTCWCRFINTHTAGTAWVIVIVNVNNNNITANMVLIDPNLETKQNYYY